MQQTNRRSYLGAVGAMGAVALAPAVAGCLGGDEDESAAEDDANGDNGGDTDDDGQADGFAVDPGTISLEGYASHWEGVAPGSIEGEQNPTLVLEDGAEYTVEWTNADGVVHDLQIWDDGGDVVDDAATDQVSGEGATAEVTFTATPEMVTYVCSFHRATQAGDIVVQ